MANLLHVLLCVLCPPLGVIHKGPKAIVIVTVLTVLGWAPGVIAAWVIGGSGKEYWANQS